jgi:uncharacterized iron-regulated membrane protein
MVSGPGDETLDQQRAASRSGVKKPAAKWTVSRVAFYSHLWFGVIFTAALIVISVTGILLNHKRGLGLMPDVPHEPSADFAVSLPLDSLAAIALRAVPMPNGGAPTLRDIDRMDVRPRDGFVKVRMRDAASTEVTVDIATGRVLHIGPRGDVFLEKLHSGEAFGGRGVLLGDAAAVVIVITIITGYWLWITPKRRRFREMGTIDDGESET